MIRVLRWMMLGLLFGCKSDVQCAEDKPCGFGEVCVEGTCQGKTCATSAQCDMEMYCNAGTCASGCAEDTDCFPGDACDAETSACASAACRQTHLDCGFKEFCNTVTGECNDAAGYYCMACADDDDCGGNGNLCLGFGVYGDFCGVTCEADTDCPAGFSCWNVTDGNGNPIASQCLTYCWLYTEEDVGVPPVELPEPPTCETEPIR